MITDRDMAAKDRVAARTAKRISAALNRMARDLPESVAAQAALADVIAELTRLEPWFLRLIFERYVRGAANTRANLRLFALEALTAADIVKPLIHETRIERLDEYLDAAPYR